MVVLDYAGLASRNIPIGSGGDGGGVQGACEAAAGRVGDEMEGAGRRCGAVAALPDVHDGPVVPVLVSDRPLGFPGGRVRIETPLT